MLGCIVTAREFHLNCRDGDEVLRVLDIGLRDVMGADIASQKLDFEKLNLIGTVLGSPTRPVSVRIAPGHTNGAGHELQPIIPHGVRVDFPV
jgi:hypothetical protein